MGIISDLEFADKFCDLVRDQAEWSQKTFGGDFVRGPLGALRHLELEAREAQDAAVNGGLTEELADCFLLVLDAARRHGLKPMQLVEAAVKKMEVNKSREWPKPTDINTPVMHIKRGEA